MTTIRIDADPAPTVAGAPVVALIRLRERLAFLGCLPPEEPPGDLDALAEETLAGLDKLGVGAVTVARLRATDDPEAWEQGLARLTEHVEASPAPAGTWPVLADLLGLDLVAALTGVSRASAQRYRAGERTTPDDVAGRLHAVAMTCADLAGSYNAFGIRRWFVRPRAALDGRAPADVLSGAWDPEDEAPRQVSRLAAALADPGAT